MSKSDSDDQEYYVSIGTPFEIEEDEPLPKPVKISDQVVLDKQGRQRFHGAFTGGFSAGYFNTVGSKEGWVPTTFKSSRGDRKEPQNISKPEDFMDEDDFADHGIAPKKLITSDKFRNDDQEIESRKRLLQKAVDEGEIHSAIPGGIIMDDLVIPSKASIGIKLLQSMGWKLGQGIGEKVPINLTNDILNESSKKIYGCMPQTSAHEMDLKTASKYLAPKDIQSFQFQLKDNVHGLGYSGINPATAMFGAPQTNDQNIFRPTGKEKRGIRGQAFGVGVFEDEDDDIYSNDKISNYDVVMADEEEKTNHGWSGAPKNEVFKGCLPGFIESSVKTSIPKPVKMLDLPSDFQPKHVFHDDGKKSFSSEVKLTSKDRSILLGEMPKPVSQWTLRWDSQPILDENKESKDKEEKKTKFTSRWDKSLLEERPKQNAESSSEPALCKSDSLFKPFAKFPEKQARYEKFLEAQKSGLQPQLLYDASTTEWERERELSEFARAAILYRPLSSSLLTNRFTRATMISTDENPKNQDLENGDVMNHKKAAQLGMFGAATRTVVEWRPEQLLCKRFNIPDPYPNMKTKGIPERIKKKGFFSDASFEDGLKMIENKISDEKQINKEDENIFEVIKSKTVLQKKKFTIGPLSHLNETNDSEPTVFKSRISEEQLKPPSIDMFKAIFDDSSSESNSEEEDEDKDDITKISSEEKNVQINQENKSSITEQSIHIQSVNISKIVESESSVIPKNNTDRPVSEEVSQNATINKFPGEITEKKLNKQPFSLAFLNEDRYKDFKDSKKGCSINLSEISVKEDSKSRHEYSRNHSRSPENRSGKLRHEYSQNHSRNSESRSRKSKQEYSRNHGRSPESRSGISRHDCSQNHGRSPESHSEKSRHAYSKNHSRSPENRSGKVSLVKKYDKSDDLIINCESSKKEEGSTDDWVENEIKSKSKNKKKKKKKKKKSVKDKKENYSSDSGSDTSNGYMSKKNPLKKVKQKKTSLKKGDDVPTSSEIYEKLKSVSSTIKKRVSAADFM